MASPEVKIRSIVEQEIKVIEHGRKVTRFVQVPSGAVGSGIKLFFTLTIVNEGDEVAINVVVDNPIPPGTYLCYRVSNECGGRFILLRR